MIYQRGGMRRPGSSQWKELRGDWWLHLASTYVERTRVQSRKWMCITASSRSFLLLGHQFHRLLRSSSLLLFLVLPMILHQSHADSTTAEEEWRSMLVYEKGCMYISVMVSSPSGCDIVCASERKRPKSGDAASYCVDAGRENWRVPCGGRRSRWHW